MSEEEYLKERLEDQIKWYDKKSSDHQNIYRYGKTTQIIISALIPFGVGYVPDFNWIAYIIGSFGVLIASIEGFLSLGKYHENWIEYRSICETLKHEKYMYLTKSGVYKEPSTEIFPYFVERVETIISQENVNWAALNNNEEK